MRCHVQTSKKPFRTCLVSIGTNHDPQSFVLCLFPTSVVVDMLSWWFLTQVSQLEMLPCFISNKLGSDFAWGIIFVYWKHHFCTRTSGPDPWNKPRNYLPGRPTLQQFRKHKLSCGMKTNVQKDYITAWNPEFWSILTSCCIRMITVQTCKNGNYGNKAYLIIIDRKYLKVDCNFFSSKVSTRW